MAMWWQENLWWTIQDQLSFPYVCWKLGFDPDVWEGDQGRNSWFSIRWHDDKVERGTPRVLGAEQGTRKKESGREQYITLKK
jgi:hypothetical protein